MSTVIPLGGGTRNGSVPLTTQLPQPSQPARQVRVSPDYRHSCLWTRISTAAPPFISQQLIDDLTASCEAIKGLPASPFRYRVLASDRPKIFSLGGDLKLFRHCIEARDRDLLAHYARSAVDAIWESISGSGYDDLFSVALVQGEAQGGGFEAALASHILIAEKGTYLGFPESLFGMFPGMGARQLLSARVGSQMAMKIIGSARRYTADELFEIGLIDVLAEKDCGSDVTANLISTTNHDALSAYKNRFSEIKKYDLLSTVDEWVNQALTLSHKHLRSIGYLIHAQERAVCTLN